VIANAGISGPDPIYINDATLDEPVEPKLSVLDVNLIGVMYTTKLALHYFQAQTPHHDTLLVFQGSIAGYGDQQGTPQYSAAKWALRGLMRGLRRTAWQHNTRVAYIAPWAVRTRILSPAIVAHVEKLGMEFATVEDAASAVMRIACDSRISGRTLAIVPRSWVKNGYVDYDLDDYPEEHPLGKAQAIGDRVAYRTAVAADKQ
jgi:NAD(P)-dependent dehydrogenase (short-subunit alcohol dehydrogenase family)